MEKKAVEFDAFNGVFVPTFLGIIGVILFLRLGYIVGAAGISKTILIILLATSVTIATGFSLSSLVTNTKVKEGGVYSIISKTLGLEAAGSVGIPLYFAQLFSVCLYLFGFTEVWRFIFPEHSLFLILTISFIAIFMLTFISLNIAIKTQLLIFALITVSLISFFAGADLTPNTTGFSLDWSFDDGTGFWKLFALFFPAVTGIIAGVGLSGELRDPSKQIPKGLLGAIIVTAVIYIAVAVFIGFSATTNQLLSNSTIMIEISAIPILVFMGILAATFSSALTTFVSAPLLLEAMAKDSLIYRGKGLVRKKINEVPKKAVFISAIPIMAALYTASLDSIAPIITMLFLVTYTIINLIVFIEQSIGLVSFRPLINIPKFIPLYGVISSIVFMFLISPIAGIFALIFVFLIYLFLIKNGIFSKEGDIRQGLFATISEWAAEKAHNMPQSTKYTWKPNILIPVINSSTLSKNWPVIKSIAHPNGTLTVLGIEMNKKNGNDTGNSCLNGMTSILKKCNREGVFTSSSNVSSECYIDAVKISLEAIQGHKLPPNILYLPFKGKKFPLKSIHQIFQVARKHHVGVIVSEDNNLQKELDDKRINVWIPGSIIDDDLLEKRKFDLTLLLGYRLFKNTGGDFVIRICVTKKNKKRAENYINKLLSESRFPKDCELVVSTMPMVESLKNTTDEGLHLIPINKYTEIGQVRKVKNIENKSVFYILDSGKEDVLA